MEALVTAFVAAFLGEWGDKTQLIVAMLAAGTKRPLQVMAGLILAALASNVAAALAGVYVAGTITIRAMTLMTALALLFAAASGLFARKSGETKIPRWPLPSAFILCLAAEMGDRTQFLTFALAGRFDSAPLAAAGATAGIIAACVPAALLGERLTSAVPVRGIRWGVAGLFLVVGFVVAVKALQLA
ncbi:MAG: Ca2+/H+ antiporter, family [Sphingomonadales bacterium]|jgi:putative Ca2+/H+ antiporter (TMEM165/GDT1 family)|nr:Ca2+/H+ antiporter, family [Sphingomonadales bacterium]